MFVYIVIYIVIGLIAGIIDDGSEKKKNFSFTLMIISAGISFLTNGIFVIAAIIEMAIGYLIIVKIKSFFNKNKTNSNIKYSPNKNLSKTFIDTNTALAKALKDLDKEEKQRLINWAVQFNISDIIENQENIESIVKLDINNNHLTYLASEINCLKNLRSLNCNNNKLTSLPISIIELYNLTELNLYNNKITSLPSNIGSMKNLSILSLSKNDLRSLPESIINLKSLKKLQLIGNESLKISENQRLWILNLIFNKIDVEIDNQLLMDKKFKDINVRNILKKAMDDVESNQSILVKSEAENIIEKVEEAKIIQNTPVKKRGLRIINKANSEKNIVKSLDNELVELKQELKTLENKLQILSEQKTEYLNDIEEFNTLYNLYLGELIKSILNLKKEILYKQTIKQQQNIKKYKEDIKVFNSTKENIEEIKQTIEEFEKILEDIDKDDENYDEIFATYKELKEELEKLENELEKQEENLSKTKEKIDNNEVFEEYEESKKQYEQFHQNYEDIKQQQSDVFDITNEQKNELKKLWKKACKLCHPDIVIDKFKEKAHEIMQALNDAYSKKDIVKVQKILSNLENGLSFEIESDNIKDKEILKSKINQYKKNILDLESEIEDLKQDDTYQTIQEIDDMNEYFEELKFELQSEKERLENEAKDILDNTKKKNIKESIKKSTPKKKTKSKIEPEKSQYSKYIQSIENPNFEKIRRYCNNLLSDNKADDMQEYLALNGKMHKALIYDSLEQFISEFNGQNVNLIDWGCNQGIGSMLILDYIKEKQLDIKVVNLNLVDNSIKALSRAMVQVDTLNINSTEIIPVNSQEESFLSKIKNKLNNITIHLFVNDKILVDFLDIDFDIFGDSYFICLSNENESITNEIYENISIFNNVQNMSIRDTKIGKFKKFERIFKISNSMDIEIDEDEIPF